jgi:hypothetical protein
VLLKAFLEKVMGGFRKKVRAESGIFEISYLLSRQAIDYASWRPQSGENVALWAFLNAASRTRLSSLQSGRQVTLRTNHNPHTDRRAARSLKHQLVLAQESRSSLPVEHSTSQSRTNG